MRTVILSPTDYKKEKNKLILIFTVWKKTLDEYQKNYMIKDHESHSVWIKTHDEMFENMQSDKTSVHCFLILNAQDTVQAIAFCGESKSKQFHIFDFLVAPWNVKASYFTSNNAVLDNTFYNLEEQLIKSILYHCSSLNYSDIIYEPTWKTKATHDLFTKLLFNPSYREWIKSIGINGYKLDEKQLKSVYRSCQFNGRVTFFSGSLHAKLFENYPDVANQSTEIILRYRIN